MTNGKQLPIGKGNRIHLLGVCGSGMIGIARMLLERGCEVSGSDLQRTEAIEELIEQGLQFVQGHDENQVAGASAIVFSTAIPEENPERQKAKQQGVLEFHRSEALASLINDAETILISGTHGKTTTSLMLAWIMKNAQREPGYYIGAESALLGGSASWGAGKQVVVEGDESDGSISRYHPKGLIVLNVENDHLDHFGNFDEIKKLFSEVTERTSGPKLLCIDDDVCCEFLSAHKDALSYGLKEGATYRAVDVHAEQQRPTFSILKGGEILGNLELSVAGLHNVSNACAAAAMAIELGVEVSIIKNSLKTFVGAGRRMETIYKDEEYHILDDYAHHPTEVEATLQAVESLGYKRTVALFQPHRFSRTRDLGAAFGASFGKADEVIISGIYPSSEKPIEGVTGDLIARAAKGAGHDKVSYSEELISAKTALAKSLKAGDVAITMGAGDVWKVSVQLSQAITLYRDVQKAVGEGSKVKLFEPMRKHTSLRVGGPADVWVEPRNEEALQRVVEYCSQNDVQMTLIGRGTNLLVKDNGIRGVCVHLGTEEFSKITVDGLTVTAAAGARLKSIVAQAKKYNIGDLEFMEGIPGNLGGALRMNAGAMKSWMFEVVKSVRHMDRDGKIYKTAVQDIEYSYRHVPLFKEHIALSAVMEGSQKNRDEVNEILNAYSKKRWSSQPAAPSAGCTFKNAEEIPTGKLIDEMGLKETSIGGARVSHVHGNFIVNDGEAKASEVLELIQVVKERAWAERGVELHEELIVLGE